MKRTWHIPAVALAAVTGAAQAGEVSLQLSTRQAYVGEAVTLQIRIANAEDYEAPELPELDGVTVRGPNMGSQESISIVNGRMTRQATITYSYVLIPTRAGELEIPPITVRADGQVHRTRARTIRVTKSETGDLLFVELGSQRDSVYFGEAIDVDLEIWMKVYRDRNLPRGLGPNDMLSLIHVQASEWGRFEHTINQVNRRETKWQYRRATRTAEDGTDQEYFVFVLPLTYVPATVGPLDPGEVRVLVSYPTRTRLKRDFFGRRSVEISQHRPIQAMLAPSGIVVLSPPEEGRPPYFNGAVGRYRFNVRAHNTDARVREPIELTLTVAGDGELDRVPAPPLASIEELTRDFKVPEERITGVVGKNRKRFVVTIRAKHPDVTEIPPVPFVYFDPVEEKYVTLQSDPIPIHVTASEQIAIAQFDEAGYGKHKAATQLTETGAGIRANYVDMDEVLGEQSFEPGWGLAALLAGSPLAYVVSFLVQRRRVRPRQDRGYARRRKARDRALAAIRAAAQAGDHSRAASGVAAAVMGYLSDRCDLPAGLTRSEAIEQLGKRDLGEKGVRQVEELLLRCEDLQYAGGDGGASDDLSERAKRCVTELEGERF